MTKHVILVTGASSGFGLMTARALAQAGHNRAGGYHAAQYSNLKLNCWDKARPSVWRLSPSQAPCPGAPSPALNRSYLVRNNRYLRVCDI
jgi:hypothetical protein